MCSHIDRQVKDWRSTDCITLLVNALYQHARTGTYQKMGIQEASPDFLGAVLGQMPRVQE